MKNLISMRLTDGNEVIAVLKDNGKYTTPMMMAAHPSGQPVLKPYVDPDMFDNEFEFSKYTIVLKYSIDKEAVHNYYDKIVEKVIAARAGIVTNAKPSIIV